LRPEGDRDPVKLFRAPGSRETILTAGETIFARVRKGPETAIG
jgi:hypothetical protein